MINEMKIKDLIKELEKLHPDDPRIKDYWEQLTKEMSISEAEAIEFISNCNEHEVYWLSAIFEDVSLNLQSRRFIDVLKEIQKKYPQLDLQMDIMYAEMSLNCS